MFLDEVDDTPLSFQVKLLRVLEDRVGQPPRREPVRGWSTSGSWRRPTAICAPLFARGLFGADLYERLAIVSIRLPPLRERLEDLPALYAT